MYIELMRIEEGYFGVPLVVEFRVRGIGRNARFDGARGARERPVVSEPRFPGGFAKRTRTTDGAIPQRPTSVGAFGPLVSSSDPLAGDTPARVSQARAVLWTWPDPVARKQGRGNQSVAQP